MNSTHNLPALSRTLVGAFIALLLGGPSAFGQFQYSVNAVGYVDATFVAGSNLVANPLNAGDNTMASLFRDLPEGAFFLPWDSGAAAFTTTNMYHMANGWTDPGALLTAPNGGFLWLPEPRNVSFVGEPWTRQCVTYPVGDSVSSVAPEFGCGFCGEFQDPCPAAVQDGTFVRKWNRTQQTWEEYYYVEGFGWVPALPTLASAEAATVSAPVSFAAQLQGPAGTPRLHSPVALRGMRRDGDQTRFEFAAATSADYTVLHCTDLSSAAWQVLQEETTIPTNGTASVTVDMATNQAAFYQLLPSLTLSNAMLVNPSRRGTSFRFQLYAPMAATYEVQKTSTLAGTAAWETVQSVSISASNVVSVTDVSATNAAAYYRARY